MLTIGNNQYRNLQEQVLKNQDDITILKNEKTISDLGISIITPVPFETADQLPADYNGEYGDAYLVGSELPYRLYIWTRSNQPNVPGYWFDWGLLNAPSTIPGPIGPQGIQGEQGTRGSLWYSQSGLPTISQGVNNNDQAINGLNGDIYQYVNGEWQLTGNIRGPQGIQGVIGPVGPQGIQGIQGIQGPKGDPAELINILGTVADENQLPMPDTLPSNTGFLISDSANVQHIWIIAGDGSTKYPYKWHDAGQFGGGTTVTIDGTSQSYAELGYVPKISMNYEIGDDTEVTSNGSEVTFSIITYFIIHTNLRHIT